MNTKEFEKLGQLFIEIGNRIKQSPQFLMQLEEFLSITSIVEESLPVDFEKINELDLFHLIREKEEHELVSILSNFNLKELREILKKYRFGSPSKLKTENQIKNYILNQLRQRKIDVFKTKDSGTH